MRKGFEWSVSLLVAVILGVIAAGIAFSAVQGKTPPVANEEVTEITEGCNNNDDCENDADGSRCIIIYQEGFAPFCGCLTSDDCGGGFCGSNNRCE